MTRKEREDDWAGQFYQKLVKVIQVEIHHKDSTPKLTVSVLARILTGTAIGIVGYQKANQVISDAVNHHLIRMKPKQTTDN